MQATTQPYMVPQRRTIILRRVRFAVNNAPVCRHRRELTMVPERGRKSNGAKARDPTGWYATDVPEDRPAMVEGCEILYHVLL